MARRVLLGAFPDGGYGLRVSQAGYDVASNPVDNEKLIFNSDWPEVLPIHVAGTLSLAANTTVTTSYPALGYSPHMTAFAKRPDLDWQHYQMSNSMLRRYWSSGFTTNSYAKVPLHEYSYEGGGVTSLQFRLYSDNFTAFCSEAVTVYYIIYHIKAF